MRLNWRIRERPDDLVRLIAFALKGLDNRLHSFAVGSACELKRSLHLGRAARKVPVRAIGFQPYLALSPSYSMTIWCNCLRLRIARTPSCEWCSLCSPTHCAPAGARSRHRLIFRRASRSSKPDEDFQLHNAHSTHYPSGTTPAPFGRCAPGVALHLYPAAVLAASRRADPPSCSRSRRGRAPPRRRDGPASPACASDCVLRTGLDLTWFRLETLTRETTMDSLEKLFEETLRDILYAEKAILKNLPKMAKKASSEKLAAAFEAHYRRDRRSGRSARADLRNDRQVGTGQAVPGHRWPC